MKMIDSPKAPRLDHMGNHMGNHIGNHTGSHVEIQ